jgi:hypothetical protein
VVWRNRSRGLPDSDNPGRIIAAQLVGFWQRLLGLKLKIPLRDKDVGTSIEVIS